MAVSLLLLVGAELVTRSLEAARRTYPGFEASHVASVEMDLRQNGYDEARGRVFYRQLIDALRADARIESATFAAFEPIAFLETPARTVAIEGYEPRRDEDLAFLFNIVDSDYFRTLRIDLRAGREFENRDDRGAAPVLMVNNTFAERFWGGAANAIGKRVRVAGGEWRDGDWRGRGYQVRADQRIAAPLFLSALSAVAQVGYDAARPRLLDCARDQPGSRRCAGGHRARSCRDARHGSADL